MKYWNELDQLISQSLNQSYNWRSLDFSQAVRLAAFHLEEQENNEELQLEIYSTVAKVNKPVVNRKLTMCLIFKIFGDPSGRLSPMAIPNILFESKSTKPLRKPYMKLLYNDKCTLNDTWDYLGAWKPWNKARGIGLEHPCHREVPLKCCGFWSSLVHDFKPLVLLTMKYAFTSFSQGHTALAEFLGLDPAMDYPIQEPKLATMCAEPGVGDVWHCPDNTVRLMWTSLGVCIAYNSPPISQVYQVLTRFLLTFHAFLKT